MLRFLSRPQASPDTANSLAIEIHGLNKQYDNGTWANRDIDLTVESGLSIGILGSNGAGKTTLMRQITTEIRPASGEIRVFGIDALSQPNAAKSLMGIVPQEARLYWDLPVWQHFRIFGKLRGLGGAQARRRADELVGILRLDDYRDSRVQQLSGGMKQRVMLGIALLADPPLLVLDEPTTGLDPRARRQVWEIIEDFKRRNATVLLTTHYMEEAEMLCSRVGIMFNGTLRDVDTVANLKANNGLKYKLVYPHVDRPHENPVQYGNDRNELIAKAIMMGVDESAVSETTLEDIYLAMTGESISGSDDHV